MPDVLLAGDVNLERDLALGPQALDPVRDTLATADLRLANLEGAFFDRPSSSPRSRAGSTASPSRTTSSQAPSTP